MAKTFLDFYAEEPLARENAFRNLEPDRSAPPSFHDPAVRARLPEPIWDSPEGEMAIACYNKTWSLAFQVRNSSGMLECDNAADKTRAVNANIGLM